MRTFHERCTTPHVTEEQLKVLFTAALNKLIACREEILSGIENAAGEVFDTTGLEAERSRLLGEMDLLSDKMQAAINENARVALDQKEYQKRYDKLAERYAQAKKKHDDVAAKISNVMSARVASQQYVATLRSIDMPIAEFSPELWGTLLDHATVYSADDIRFTFRNGVEIRA